MATVPQHTPIHNGIDPASVVYEKIAVGAGRPGMNHAVVFSIHVDGKGKNSVFVFAVWRGATPQGAGWGVPGAARWSGSGDGGEAGGGVAWPPRRGTGR